MMKIDFRFIRFQLIFHFELCSMQPYHPHKTKITTWQDKESLDMTGCAWSHPTNSNSFTYYLSLVTNNLYAKNLIYWLFPSTDIDNIEDQRILLSNEKIEHFAN